MSELHVMSAKCPGCQTSIRVKTHSTSKTVNCPKCKTPVTLEAPTRDAAAPEEDLPEAQLWTDAGAAQSSGNSRNVLGVVVVVVLVLGAIGAFFVLRGNKDVASPTSVVQKTSPVITV